MNTTTSGPNKIDGTNNAETLNGTQGDDSINALAGGDIINGGMGNDSVSAGLGDDTVNGGAGKDTILGGAGDDVIDGGEGDDLLRGQVGNDTILGGEGNDNISGGTENDLIEGGAGNDKLFGDEHDDTLVGGAGADRLDGGADDDLLIGGEGADYLKGGTGKDTFQFDQVKDNPTGAALNAKELDTIADFVSGEDKLNIQVDGKTIAPTSANFKTIDASIYKGAAPMLTALAAMPVEGTQFVYLYNLAGGGTSGYLVVLEGSTTGTVVKYAVQMLGATAADDLSVEDFVQPAPVVVDPNEPVETEYNVIIGTDASFEEIRGTDGADSIEGLGGTNVVFALAGNDIVNGGDKNDYLYGEDGDDVIDLGKNIGTSTNENAYGGSGNDKITGRFSAELEGNEGNDTLIAGEGADFVFMEGNEDGDVYRVSGLAKKVFIKDFDESRERDFEIKPDGSLDTPVDTVEFDNSVKKSDLSFQIIQDSSSFESNPNTLLITSTTNPEFRLEVRGQFDEFIALAEGPRDDGYDYGYDYGGEGEGEVADGPMIDVGESAAIENRIELFKFADGSSLTSDEIFQLANKLTDFDDVFIGSVLSDDIDGLQGDDALFGYAGNDSINGADGDDTLYGGNGDDLIKGGSGENQLYGEGGNDTIISTSSLDIVDGGNGDDTIEMYGNEFSSFFAHGGNGNDTFILKGEGNWADGGAGNDTYELYEKSSLIQDQRGGNDTYVVHALDLGANNRNAVGVYDQESFPRFVFNNETGQFEQIKVDETDTIIFDSDTTTTIDETDVHFSRIGGGRDLLISVMNDEGKSQLIVVNAFFDQSTGQFGNQSTTIEAFKFDYNEMTYTADDVVFAIEHEDGYLASSQAVLGS